MANRRVEPLRILVVCAHPDDESFGPAAVLAKYARQGAEIYGLFATRGEHGEPNIQPPPAPHELARIREADLGDATAVIGFEGIEILHYEDGKVAEAPEEELEAHVLAAIHGHRPQVVHTFGPGGITHHPDHMAVHRAAAAAFHRARQEGLGVRELYYDAVPTERALEMGIADLPDGQPNTWVDVAETADIMVEALRLHGRHITDAAERAVQLTENPRTVATLHRAWPPVPGKALRGLLEE